MFKIKNNKLRIETFAQRKKYGIIKIGGILWMM